MAGGSPIPSARSRSAYALAIWAMYDWGSSAFAAIIQTFIFATYFARRVAETEEAGTSAWGYTLGTAGLIVALGGPILGAIADEGRHRHRWLALLTGLGVAGTALLWFIGPSPDYFWPAVLLVIVASIGAEYAFIFYNAMLPDLVPADRTGRWSGWGWAAGYVGGVVSLAIALLLVGEDAGDTDRIRATFPLAACWYLLFALPLLVWAPRVSGAGKPWRRAIRDGLRQLKDTLRQVWRHGSLVRFLAAHMIYTDALATVFAIGGIYAAGTFGMDERQVLLFGIALNITAGLGAASFAWIDDWIGPRLTIVISLVGLIAGGSAVLLVRSADMFWAAGMAVGVFVGPVQAASRSYMARAAPPELRHQMFGLYALSGKATAFVGPVTVAWLTAWTHNQRIGLSIVIVMFTAGLLLMLTVPRPEEAIR